MYGLFEDEDDGLLGSPKSKLMDVLFNANNDIVRMELEKFVQRTAAMEILLEEQLGENFYDKVNKLTIMKQDDVEIKAKSLYIELMGAILSQSE
ncbi:MAG: hypothetical protein COB17_05070 [Sulfurimonas sp.]|nr:MAG: hypothetical protein COB17_05070 [Sulfurimonas sp.]